MPEPFSPIDSLRAAEMVGSISARGGARCRLIGAAFLEARNIRHRATRPAHNKALSYRSIPVPNRKISTAALDRIAVVLPTWRLHGAVSNVAKGGKKSRSNCKG